MSIKEVLKIAEIELELCSNEEASAVTHIDLLKLNELRKKVKCFGQYEDYAEDENSELVVWGSKAYSHDDVSFRVYYDTTSDTVEETRTSWDMYGTISYHYDSTKKDLVDDRGIEPISREYAKYYRACKNDVPYFKPINISGGLKIDSDLNIYHGEKFLVSLDSINHVIHNPGAYDEEDIKNAMSLLSLPLVQISDLPTIYRIYLGYDDSEVEEQFSL